MTRGTKRSDAEVARDALLICRRLGCELEALARVFNEFSRALSECSRATRQVSNMGADWERPNSAAPHKR